MKIIYSLCILPLVFSNRIPKEKALSFLRARRGLSEWVWDTNWESVSDQIEEDENIPENTKEEVQTCCESYGAAFEEYDELSERWKEAGGATDPQNGAYPQAPEWNCTLNGEKIDIAQYAGKEWF